eukprot:271810_1
MLSTRRAYNKTPVNCSINISLVHSEANISIDVLKMGCDSEDHKPEKALDKVNEKDAGPGRRYRDRDWWVARPEDFANDVLCSDGFEFTRKDVWEHFRMLAHGRDLLWFYKPMFDFAREKPLKIRRHPEYSEWADVLGKRFRQFAENSVHSLRDRDIGPWDSVLNKAHRTIFGGEFPGTATEQHYEALLRSCGDSTIRVLILAMKNARRFDAQLQRMCARQIFDERYGEAGANNPRRPGKLSRTALRNLPKLVVTRVAEFKIPTEGVVGHKRKREEAVDADIVNDSDVKAIQQMRDHFGGDENIFVIGNVSRDLILHPKKTTTIDEQNHVALWWDWPCELGSDGSRLLFLLRYFASLPGRLYATERLVGALDEILFLSDV